jgi:LAS superfamily LD-carboxypeptidase LdcB
VALVGLAVAGPAVEAGAKEHTPEARRREVQHKRARQAAEVNVLKASDAELERALDLLDANVRASEARAASARQAADAAAAAAEAARRAEQRTAAQLDDLRRSMRNAAVDAYVRGPSHQAMVPLRAASLSELATRRYLFDVALGEGANVADRLRAATEDLAVQRAAAEDAQGRAEARRREVDAEVAGATRARELKQQVADSVEQRLERALAEADSLAALDQQLAAEIARRQAALAARVASTARARSGRGGTTRVGAVTVTSVRGITVAASIADRLEALLAAAEADGFRLGGSGYRSSDGQVAARRAHCGPSDYDVYERPASSCRPPTARPGQSMHEQGLAVDFTWNGALITSRSNPAFQWLSRNAGRFGLYNLPAEPWHWSTNGQ